MKKTLGGRIAARRRATSGAAAAGARTNQSRRIAEKLQRANDEIGTEETRRNDHGGRTTGRGAGEHLARLGLRQALRNLLVRRADVHATRAAKSTTNLRSTSDRFGPG